VAERFEKRARHKTRNDRYEQAGTKRKSGKASADFISSSKRKDKKRPKPGWDLAEKFRSDAILDDKLTVSFWVGTTTHV